MLRPSERKAQKKFFRICASKPTQLVSSKDEEDDAEGAPRLYVEKDPATGEPIMHVRPTETFDTDFPPENPHNRKVAVRLGLKYNPEKEVYEDDEGCCIRDKFGQLL